MVLRTLEALAPCSVLRITLRNCSLISGVKMSPCLAPVRDSRIASASACLRSVISCERFVLRCCGAALRSFRYCWTRCVKSRKAGDSGFAGGIWGGPAATGLHKAPACTIKKTIVLTSTGLLFMNHFLDGFLHRSLHRVLDGGFHLPMGQGVLACSCNRLLDRSLEGRSQRRHLFSHRAGSLGCYFGLRSGCICFCRIASLVKAGG